VGDGHADGEVDGDTDDETDDGTDDETDDENIAPQSRPMAPSVEPESCASTSGAPAGFVSIALFGLCALRALSARRRRALALSIATLAIGAACANPDDGRDHFEPIDTRDNLLEQGVYNCTEHTDTGYRQGDAFTIHVVTVDGKPVERDTANAYIVMQQAAAQDGVDIRIVSGFRTMEQQEYLYGCYVNCNCNSCNLAATPGYSNHQSGHALDLNTSEGGVLTWLNNHGDEFGFERTVPSEPWHWEWWGGGPGGGPCTDVPASCVSGDYNGAFCDDEGANSEAAHDCLVEDLGVDFHCQDIEGSPAYCGGNEATRAQLAFVFGAAADIPLDGHPNGWVDDEGHARERYLDAFKAYGIYTGFASGTEVHPDATISRSTIAIVVARMYALPPATQDYFSDDEGSANEEAHNQLGDLGFTGGCGGGKFCGGDVADRSTLARFACGLGERALTPVWLQTPPPNEAPGDPVAPPDDEPSDPEVPPDDEAPPETEAPPESEPTTDDEEPARFAPSVADDGEGGCASVEPGSIGALLVLLGAITSKRRRRRKRQRT
jgi:hypothetical protein